MKLSVIQYYPNSRKLWQALNLANQSSECIGGFFKFGDFPHNCQFAKLKSCQSFLLYLFLACIVLNYVIIIICTLMIL